LKKKNTDNWNIPGWLKVLLLVMAVLYLIAIVILRSGGPVREGFPFFRQ
jgi:hypothetical protein